MMLLIHVPSISSSMYQTITGSNEYNKFIHDSPWGYITLASTSILIILIVAILSRLIYPKLSSKELGTIINLGSMKAFLGGFLLCLLTIVAYITLGVITSGVTYVGMWVVGFSAKEIMGFFLSSLTVGLIAAIAEESYFRGFIIANLRLVIDRRWIWIMISMLFFIPSNLYEGIYLLDICTIICTGILLGYLYSISNSIWLAAGFHFANHFLLEAIINIIHNPYYGGPVIFLFEQQNNITVNGFVAGSSMNLFVCITYILTLIVLCFLKKGKFNNEDKTNL